MFEQKPTFKGKWKNDSSVIIDGRDGEGDFCDGSCRDDCECDQYCECEQCQMCNGCNCDINNCHCDNCLYCYDCEEHINTDGLCECEITKSSTCIIEHCTDDNICENCMILFKNNRNIGYKCYGEGHGTYINCDLSSCGCECSCECTHDHEGNVGEFVSIPLNVNEIDEWVTKCYPQKTNSTCGGHVHISLKSYADYMNLMDRSFYEYYLERMAKWGTIHKIKEGSSFWKRLEGAQYCHAKFMPKEQRDMFEHYEDPRYAQINYCFNVDNRQTVEFRMLPCFQKESLMLSGIKETIDIVETYLSGIDPNNNMIKLRIEI
jgi:hypothetical protein